jgi:hypothetical protein
MNVVKSLTLTLALALMGVAGLALLGADVVAAVDPATQVNNGVTAAGGSGQKSLQVRVADIINVLLFIIGAVSVIMIILGGLKYVLSNGDSSQITSAKNTILYAVIGLVVALLAYAIVNFVVVQFTK